MDTDIDKRVERANRKALLAGDRDFAPFALADPEERKNLFDAIKDKTPPTEAQILKVGHDSLLTLQCDVKGLSVADTKTMIKLCYIVNNFAVSLNHLIIRPHPDYAPFAPQKWYNQDNILIKTVLESCDASSPKFHHFRQIRDKLEHMISSERKSLENAIVVAWWKVVAHTMSVSCASDENHEAKKQTLYSRVGDSVLVCYPCEKEEDSDNEDCNPEVQDWDNWYDCQILHMYAMESSQAMSMVVKLPDFDPGMPRAIYEKRAYAYDEYVLTYTYVNGEWRYGGMNDYESMVLHQSHSKWVAVIDNYKSLWPHRFTTSMIPQLLKNRKIRILKELLNIIFAFCGG